MKKVLAFGMTHIQGGVEGVIMNYYRHIDRSKIQFDFISYDSEPAYADEIRKLGGKVFVIPGRRHSLRECRKSLDDILKNNHYDAVWSNLCYMGDLIVLQKAKKAGIAKRIVHAHNSQNMSSTVNGMLHKLNRFRISRIATDYWSCSQPASDFFYSKDLQMSPRHRIIPNAVDVSKFSYDPEIRRQKRIELGIPEDCLVIGNVGRLHFQKNQEFLLRIFQKVHQKEPNSVLLIAGVGELLEPLQKQAEELGITESVRFLGSRNDVPELMQVMDCFVLPSRFEGLCLVLIEAQATGLPCMVSKDVITAEIGITDLVDFISLESSPDVWAEHVLSSQNGKVRRSRRKDIAEHGYEIDSAAESLLELLTK